MSKPAPVPPAARVMIALCASPTLMVIGFLVYNLVTGQWGNIAVSTIVFTLLGLYAYTVVFTGRIPFTKKSSDSQID